MLYIFNKTISDSKNILYSLTTLYGINKFQSYKICKNIGINPKISINKLKNNHVNRIITYINKNLKIEHFLRKSKTERLHELLKIKTNRGIRYSQGLPVRGQRTHTNAKTSKNKKSNFLKKNSLRNKSLFSRKKNHYKKK